MLATPCRVLVVPTPSCQRWLRTCGSGIRSRSPARMGTRASCGWCRASRASTRRFPCTQMQCACAVVIMVTTTAPMRAAMAAQCVTVAASRKRRSGAPSVTLQTTKRMTSATLAAIILAASSATALPAPGSGRIRSENTSPVRGRTWLTSLVTRVMTA